MTKGATQQTISSFFQSSPAKDPPPRNLKRRGSSPIDLTSDDHEVIQERSTKRPRRSSPSKSPPPRVNSTQVTGGGVAEQWRFGADSSQASPQRQLTNAERKSRKNIHEAFKRKLLLDNSRFLKPLNEPLTTASGDDDNDDAESAATEEEGSDDAFRKLTEMFTNKGKGKNKTLAPSQRRTQKVVEVGPSGQKYTPLELQVLQLKKDNPGTLLMIEVGYKYKFFGDDAKVAAKELGMVAFNDRNFLTASIPTHRRDVHMKKLLARGYRVGIVNQIETAALKKISENKNKPFQRKVTHLYTAATFVDDLDSVDDVERYNPPPFMCLIEEPKGKSSSDVCVGMITICPSTGDVVWDDFEDTLMRIELETRLVHSRPAELLLPKQGLSEATTKMLQHFDGITTSGLKLRTELFDEKMSYTDAFSLVSKFYTDKKKMGAASEKFQSGTLMAEAADLPKRVIIALAHAINHLSAFSIADALLETRFFSQFSTRAHMLLGANTLNNLEIYQNDTDGTTHGSLMWILDKTRTKFGARLLKSWIGRPLVDRRVLQERIDAVEEILSSSSEKLVTLRQILKGLPDLAKSLCRILYGQCTPYELSILLPAFNKVAIAFDGVEDSASVGLKSNLLNDIISALPKLKEPIMELLGAINLKKAAGGRKDTMWTDPEKYPEIANTDLAIQTVEVELMDELKSIRKLLRMPTLQWTSVAGDEYLIEVKRSDKRPIPDFWTIHTKTKYLDRYQPPNVRLKLEEKAQYEETLQAESNRAFRLFLEEISQKYYTILRDAVNKLAAADCLLSFAHVALQSNYVRPEFTDEDVVEIVDGRHPMIEVLRVDPFVPNSISMGDDCPRSKIITGPNMGGKSSCVRMVALIVIMAQIGSYVPATSLRMGLLDGIFTRMGASDDLAKGRSTFMVEMSETSEILHAATEKSLVILDELGRGTSTFDGMAIAEAVLQQLIEKTKSKTLFITHYPLVASNIVNKFPEQVENLHMGYEADSRIDGTRTIVFLYRLISGMATESFGVECGRLAGLPEPILNVAAECSCTMQEQVEERIRRNKIRKTAHLINACLHSSGIAASVAVEELRVMVESLFTSDT